MKAMKKLCLSILALLLVTIAVFGFTACGEEEGEECVHEWSEWETVTPSTCVEAGKEKRVCALDETHFEERDIAKAEHTFTVYVSNNDATCTADGTKTAICDVEGCGEKHVMSDFGSMLAHTFDQKITSENYINSMADCDDKATYFYSCKCGEKGTKVFEDGDYLHVYSKDFTFDENEHWHACVCSDEECTCTKRSDIAEHVWNEGTVTLEPTCDAEGTLVYTCECGATKSEVIPVKHALVRTAKKNATCIAAGNIEYWQCEDCGKCFTDAEALTGIIPEAVVIPALEHDFANGIWTFTNTTHAKKCANCEAIDSANTKSHALTPMSTADQHWYGCECGYKEGVQDHALTLKYNGDYHWFVCSCGFESVKHNHKEAQNAIPLEYDAPDCDNDGYAIYECATCPLTFRKTIPAAHANLTIHVNKSASTCTEQGNIEYWQCEACNRYFRDSEAKEEIQLTDIPTNPLGHDFENGVLGRDALGHYTACSRCGVIDENNRETHIYVPRFNETYHFKLCSACGYKAEEAEHVWANPTVELEPTCNAEGTLVYTCECGATKSEPIPIKHNPVLVEAKGATCTATGNFSYWQCEDCGKCFDSASATTEIAIESTVTPVIPHNFNNGTWNYTADTHAKTCADCDAINEFVSHEFVIPGNDSEKHWMACECGCRQDVLPHEFTFESLNGNYHLKKCACGYENYDVLHQFKAVYVNETKHTHVCECGFDTGTIDGKLTTVCDADSHWQECEHGYKTDVAGHSFKTEYINSTQHYHVCDCGYRSNAITGKLTLEYNATGHWGKCSCGYRTEAEEHVITVKYIDDTQHWHECECGYASDFIEGGLTEYRDEFKHWYECACNYNNAKDHTLTATKVDENHHKYTCECGEFETAPVSHEYKAVYVSDTQHAHVCECDYKIDSEGALTFHSSGDEHWQECSHGYTTDISKHSFVTKHDGTQHWEECACGSIVNTEEHEIIAVYLSDTQHSHKCECGYSIDMDGALTAEYKYNGIGHWQECDCGYKTEISNHNCEFYSDETAHSSKCSCGYEDVPYTNHTWGNGKITAPTTCISKGVKTYTCVCGATRTEEFGASIHDSHGNLKHVPGYEASCTEVGRIEYWYCEDCHYYFEDAETTVIISLEDTYIYVSHDFVNGEWVLNENGQSHAKACANCGILSMWKEHVIKEYSANSTHHWVGCECGFLKNGEALEEHTLSYAYDGDRHYFSCDVCDYVSSEEHTLVYNMNATQHWYKCHCGYETAPVDHCYATSSHNDTHHYQVCECGLTSNEVEHNLVLTFTPHTHKESCSCGYESESKHEFEIKFSDTQHWYECSCRLITSAENHSMNTKTEGNYYWTECNCGFKTAKVEKENE